MIPAKQTPVLGNAASAINETLLRAARPAERLAVRVGEENRIALSKILGVELPATPSATTVTGDRSALWLGPDEWLVIDGEGSGLADLASKQQAFPCSLVDISHRNTAIKMSGAHVCETLNAGCPQDLRLDAFPVGKCSRTVMGKAEIIFWRTSENSFRVEVWRSFADYVWAYLVDATKAAR